jgi:hypothetical protein
MPIAESPRGIQELRQGRKELQDRKLLKGNISIDEI